jgi:RNA polymerase sigma factor (sigma-70 family)
MIDPDVNELIDGCVAGDRKSQQRVYEMHYSKMLGVCIRYARDVDQAQDILQDGFIKVFSNIAKFNRQGSFEGWIRRIMVNTSIDFFRKNKNEYLLLGNDESIEKYMPVEFEEEEEDQEFEFTASQVIEAMQSLSPAYRTIFNMYVFENLQHKQIAEKLGISVGTSKSNLAKAKKNLKKILLKEFRKADGKQLN